MKATGLSKHSTHRIAGTRANQQRSMDHAKYDLPQHRCENDLIGRRQEQGNRT